MTAPIIPNYRSRAAVARENGISVRTLTKKVRAGQFPMPILFGNRHYWPVETLRRFYRKRDGL